MFYKDQGGHFVGKEEDGQPCFHNGNEFRQNTDYSEILKNSIKLPDETIPKSVGAKWANEYIAMPDGTKAKFVEGSKVTNKEVFAGKGTKHPIRDIDRLVIQYPNTKRSLWQKVKEIGRAHV